MWLWWRLLWWFRRWRWHWVAFYNNAAPAFCCGWWAADMYQHQLSSTDTHKHTQKHTNGHIHTQRYTQTQTDAQGQWWAQDTSPTVVNHWWQDRAQALGQGQDKCEKERGATSATMSNTDLVDVSQCQEWRYTTALTEPNDWGDGKGFARHVTMVTSWIEHVVKN